jgi:hypothetical protein
VGHQPLNCTTFAPLTTERTTRVVNPTHRTLDGQVRKKVCVLNWKIDAFLPMGRLDITFAE